MGNHARRTTYWPSIEFIAQGGLIIVIRHDEDGSSTQSETSANPEGFARDALARFLDETHVGYRI